jgi:hypothetical protein
MMSAGSSCGPGNLHLINGLFDCHRSRVPVLAIAAQVPSPEIGSGYFQETHPEHLFKGLCCNFEYHGIAGRSESDYRVSGGQAEHFVDELILTSHIISPAHPPNLPIAQHVIASYPRIVRRAAWNSRNPCLAFTRRLMARWSCSMMLFKYCTDR